ncbi:MAG: antibiotic biosynthesis monooxygenase family protein [Aestuariivirga sp.]
MIAVIFEVWPAPGEERHYLDLAEALRAELVAMDGFISIERYRNLNEPEKLLSLSFWRDEAAVAAWRNTPSHRATQKKGRDGVFSNYRLRIATVLRDYGMNERAEAPDDSKKAHDHRA